MLSDPIADMLTRIRNGYLARKKTVTIVYSRLNEQILKMLENNRFIGTVTKLKPDSRGKKSAFFVLKAELVYPQGRPAVEMIRRISKPGRRLYQKAKKIKSSLSGYGLYVLSTPKGVMSGQDAKKKNLGGEALFEIW